MFVLQSHQAIICLTHWILWKHMSTASSWCFPIISPNCSRNWRWHAQESSTMPIDWWRRNGPFSNGLSAFPWMGFLSHDQKLKCPQYLLIRHQSALTLKCGMPFADGWETSPDYFLSVTLEQFRFNKTAVDKGKLPFLVIKTVCCKMHEKLQGRVGVAIFRVFPSLLVYSWKEEKGCILAFLIRITKFFLF